MPTPQITGYSQVAALELLERTNCGKCSLCCKLLEIEPEPEKDYEGKGWNKWCPACKPGQQLGGCTRYNNQPTACSSFKCVWLQTQQRRDVPSMAYPLKPSKSHVILVLPEDPNQAIVFAFVDPKFPAAWRNEPMRSALIFKANQGTTVIIVVDNDRYLMTKDRPTIKLTPDQLQQLDNIRMNSDGTIQMSKKSSNLQRSEALSSTIMGASSSFNVVPSKE